MSKLGIIVPYRDRKEHLDSFLPSISTYLSDRDVNYQIYIVEQTDTEPFNRGALLNLGAKKAIEDGCDKLCFHDVDLIPVDVDYNVTLRDWPVELVKEVRDSKEPIAYNYFGGAALVTSKMFLDVDGYSNNYKGWGYEDDDFFLRLVKKGYTRCSVGFPVPVTFGKGIKLPGPKIEFPCTKPEKDKHVILVADFIPKPSPKTAGKDMKILTIPTEKDTECSISYDRFGGFRFDIWDSKYGYHHLTTEKLPPIHSRILVDLDLVNKEFYFFHNGVYCESCLLDSKRTFNFDIKELDFGFSKKDDTVFEGVLLEAGMLYYPGPITQEQGERWTLSPIDDLPDETIIYWISGKEESEFRTVNVSCEDYVTVPVPCKSGGGGVFDHLYHFRSDTSNGNLSEEAIRNQARFYRVSKGRVRENDGLSTIEDLYSTEISEYQENVTWIKAIKK